MKNYYDELEINPKASKEVIEKVYKVLAKKYHPDTTEETDKHTAEEKFKIISEAYEVLSNDEKRKKYDLELQKSNPTISYEDYVNIINERDALTNALNNLKTQVKNSSNTNQQYYNNTSHTHYNQTNANKQYYNNNGTQNNQYNTSQGYYAPNYNTKSKKKTYYYTDTGKPASAFAYYKYKIKNFFQNIGLIILTIIAIALAINAFMGYNLL